MVKHRFLSADAYFHCRIVLFRAISIDIFFAVISSYHIWRWIRVNCIVDSRVDSNDSFLLWQYVFFLISYMIKKMVCLRPLNQDYMKIFACNWRTVCILFSIIYSIKRINWVKYSGQREYYYRSKYILFILKYIL